MPPSRTEAAWSCGGLRHRGGPDRPGRGHRPGGAGCRGRARCPSWARCRRAVGHGRLRAGRRPGGSRQPSAGRPAGLWAWRTAAYGRGRRVRCCSPGLAGRSGPLRPSSPSGRPSVRNPAAGVRRAGWRQERGRRALWARRAPPMRPARRGRLARPAHPRCPVRPRRPQGAHRTRVRCPTPGAPTAAGPPAGRRRPRSRCSRLSPQLHDGAGPRPGLSFKMRFGLQDAVRNPGVRATGGRYRRLSQVPAFPTACQGAVSRGCDCLSILYAGQKRRICCYADQVVHKASLPRAMAR